jgi:hypothetical protein
MDLSFSDEPRQSGCVLRRLSLFRLEARWRGLAYDELCAAHGVSYPMRRVCCQEQFGMTPKRHLLLRRLNLERRAVDEAVLYKANPGERRDRLHYGYR